MLHMYSPRKSGLSARCSYFETPSSSPKILGQVSRFCVPRLGGHGSRQFHCILPQITLSSKTKQLLGNFRLNPCLLKLPGKLAPDTTVNCACLQQLVSCVKRLEGRRTDWVKVSIHSLNELESKSNTWQRTRVTQIANLVTCQHMAETHICSF